MPLPSRIAKYEIRRPLKQGGMGVLYLGFDPELERPVAIKVLRDDLEGEEPRTRFIREARAAAGLRHPNIVTIYDFGFDAGHPFIVMELVPGVTLADLIAQRAPPSLPRRLQIVEDLCGALGYAHRMHLVHRDIKPGNVMCDPEGVIKVLDFGLARTADSALTREGIVLGTLNYMSPEQLAGGPVDHRSDIFAVGAVLYELLAFKRAFGGGVSDGVIVRILHREPEPLPRLAADLDGELADVVHRALRKAPADRYQDLSAMRLDLLRIRGRLERAVTEPIVRPGGGARRGPAPGARDAVLRVGGVALLDAAREAITTGEFERAVAACDAAVDLDPGTLEAASTLRQEANRLRAVALTRALGGPAIDVTTTPAQARLAARTGFVAALLVAVLALAFAYSPITGRRTSPAAAPGPARDGRADDREPAPAGAPTGMPVEAPLAASRSAGPGPAASTRTPPAAGRPARVERAEAAAPDGGSGSARPVASLTAPPGRDGRRREPPDREAPGRAAPESGAAAATAASPAPAVRDAAAPAPLGGRPIAPGGVATPASPGGVAAAAVPGARPADDRALIEATLQRYAAAMSARDIDALAAVLAMDAGARRRQRTAFGQYAALSVALRPVAPPVVAGAKATVRCRLDEVFEIRGRSRQSATSLIEVTLQKTGQGWMVVGFADR